MDDNVHFQNAAVMEKALVEADIDFDDFVSEISFSIVKLIYKYEPSTRTSCFMI